MYQGVTFVTLVQYVCMLKLFQHSGIHSGYHLQGQCLAEGTRGPISQCNSLKGEVWLKVGYIKGPLSVYGTMSLPHCSSRKIYISTELPKPYFLTAKSAIHRVLIFMHIYNPTMQCNLHLTPVCLQMVTHLNYSGQRTVECLQVLSMLLITDVDVVVMRKN
jgi:hypothetical protein